MTAHDPDLRRLEPITNSCPCRRCGRWVTAIRWASEDCAGSRPDGDEVRTDAVPTRCPVVGPGSTQMDHDVLGAVRCDAHRDE